MIKIDELLKVMVEMQASDLHLKPMRPPLLRKDGALRPLKFGILEPANIEETVKSLLKEKHIKELEQYQAVDVGYSVPGVSRFRVNIFVQRGTFGAVFRRIPINIPRIDDWGLPPVLRDFTKMIQGLVLITGPTGSGKSSTLAAMIREINESRTVHIITIEDPIEFLFRDEKAAITQREVGMDTPSFQQALRNSLRQDPDIIMVGEMRDLPTIETAITAAETGHLVLSTLHTNSAAQSVDRIMDAFPANQQKQVRMQLAQVLQGIISLQLVQKKDGSGMIAAVEVCRNSPIIAKMIEENRVDDIYEEMSKSVAYFKMQTMNQSFLALIVHNQVSREVAMAASPNPDELDLNLRKIFFGSSNTGGNMAECYSDYSKIEELLESQKLVNDLQEKMKFEIETRQAKINELETELREQDARVQSAIEQLDRLLKEKEQAVAEREKLREQYEKKVYQMRKHYEDRIRQTPKR